MPKESKGDEDEIFYDFSDHANMFEKLLSNFAHLVLVSSFPQSEKCDCYVLDILFPQRSIRHWFAFKELILPLGRLTYGQTNTN